MAKDYIDKLESKLEKSQYGNAWRAKLSEALAPDPSEWRFTGEIGEDDSGLAKCACGHSIKYLFHLERERDGKKVIVGSSCIEHYGEANPELVESIKAANEDLKKRIQEEKKAAKRAAQEAEVDKIRDEWESLWNKGYKVYKAYRDRGEKAPYDLWEIYGSYYGVALNSPRYKTPKGYINWYKRQTEILTYKYNRLPHYVQEKIGWNS